MYCLIFFKDTDAHPGFVSLLIVFATILFILFIKDDSFIYKAITLKVFLFLGIISYSLYLYHQPILVFYRFNYGEISNRAFIILFVLMILISYLSYKFFENPIRRSKNNKKYLILLAFIIFIAIFYGGAKYTDGYKFMQKQKTMQYLKHFEKVEYRRLEQETTGLSITNKQRKECSNRTPSTACSIKNKGKNLLVIGDSYAGVFEYSLSQQKNLNITFFTYEQCPFLDPKDNIYFGPFKCQQINKLRWIEIEKMKPSNILIGTNFNQFNSGKKYIQGKSKELHESVPKKYIYENFRKNIQKLISLGHHPIVLLQSPTPLGYDVAKEFKRRVNNGELTFKEERKAKPTTNIDNEVRDALKGLNVKFIDINAKMCKNEKCLTFNKNGGLYNNSAHLSYFGVQIFIDDIIKILK